MNSQIMAIPVIELARSRVQRETRQPLVRRVVDLLLKHTSLATASWLDRDTRRMHDSAVWFVGAAAELDRADPGPMIDDSGAMLGNLHTIEADLLARREAFLPLVATSTQYQSEGAKAINRAVARHLAAAADLYAAVREFRGAYQAFEANCCALVMAQQRVAHTTQQLQSDLNALNSWSPMSGAGGVRIVAGVVVSSTMFKNSFKAIKAEPLREQIRQSIRNLLMADLDLLPAKLHCHPLTNRQVQSALDPHKKVSAWSLHVTPDDAYKASFTFEGGVAYFRLVDTHDVIDKRP